MFSPQSIPKVNRRRRSPVEEWSAASPLPWNPAHRPEFARTTKSPARTSGSRPGKPVAYEWRHTVYLWVFPLTDLYRALELVFPFDQESFDPRPGGESALATVVVDQDGFPMTDSAVLSACGWAAGIVGRHRGQVERLDGFDSAQEDWLKQVNEVVAEGADEPDPEPLDEAAVCALAEMTSAFTRFPNLSGSGAIRIQSQQIRSDGKQDVQADFLNSFFLDDLAVVAAAASSSRRSHGLGRALTRYLSARSAVAPEDRIDVQDDLAAVASATAPGQMPDGRWPSKPDEQLALSQQLAVNLITQDAGHGLFAVNGPPGTGKTTMLRDLFAARVVERAHRLAALAKPEDGFGPPLPSWRSDQWPRTVHPPIKQLTGFEMVVASSNNAAVNNISDEIPSAKEIKPPYEGLIDYFTDIATATLQPVRTDVGEAVEPDDETDDSAPVAHDGVRIGWALTAARLGKKTNRSTFKTRFWIGDKKLDLSYEAMQPLLQRWKSEPVDPRDWSDAVEGFREAVAAERGAIAVRQHVAAAMDQLTETTRALAEARHRWQQAAVTARSLADERARLDAESAAVREELRTLAELAVSRRPPRPGWLRNALTLGTASRQWAAEGGLETQEDDRRRRAQARLDEVTSANHHVAEHYQRTGQLLDDLRQEIEHHQAAKDAATRVLDDAPTTWGDAMPSPGWWHRDVERREKAGPWLDEEVNDLRVRVLLAGLDLHRAFVRGNAATFETSLRASMDVLTGAVPSEVPAATRLAAWQVLFLVVPLVSTTFASVGRMFTGLPPEGLGWLLIDEAGQSAPQVAVGAMWRASNVVVVGDPRQLQPVVTITPRLEGALAKAYGVDDKWRPLTTSVQAVADESARWGTWLAPTAEEPRLWIGAPLRVHRRCDQPMLTICNEIAYPVNGQTDAAGDGGASNGRSGLMIDGVPARKDLALPRSQWYHQRTVTSQGHFVPAEMILLRELLDDILRAGVPLREIICISPFRDTADRLGGLADVYGDEFRGGTIHTAQGQEADVVFLVLGGDPDKPGAKAWASRIPNLVNVAVSRAKRRLYVVGDETAWSSYPFFDVLSARLRDHAKRMDGPSPQGP